MTKPEDFGTEAGDNPNCGYCCHCYSEGTLRNGVTMEELTADIQKLNVNQTELINDYQREVW
jgi:hypothetical protein